MGKVIKFGTKVFYMDPDYSSLDLMITGTVSVEAPGREDDQSFEQTVRDTVSQLVQAKSQELSGMKVSYKDLQMHNSEYSDVIKNQLKTDGITVTSVAIATVNPTEDARQHIASVDKIKSLSNMSDKDLEEMKRKAEEARLAYLASPAGQMAMSGPKFCTECGSATNGARFCPNCGKKLI